MDAAVEELRAEGDLEIRLLGPVSAERAARSLDLGSPKQRAVLAVLALRAGDAVDRDAILTAVWGSDVDAARARSLHTYVSNLRTALDGRVTRHQGGYRLDVPAHSVDALRFEQVVQTARRTYVTDRVQTADRLRDSLSWWRGRPFSGLGETPGLDADARRLDALRLDAVELRIEADLLCGRHEALVAELAALASEHPLRERFRAQHMVALYRCGRPVEALHSYRETVRYLADELGVEPTAELQRLEHAILAHDADLLAGPRHATTQHMAILVVDLDEDDGRGHVVRPFPEALSRLDGMTAEAVALGKGRILRTASGRSAAVFADVLGAITAAEHLVRATWRPEPGRTDAATVRMAIDQGDVEIRGSTVVGPAVTRAVRLCGVAHGSQILLSASASNHVTASSPPGFQLRLLGQHSLHGFASPERISQLVVNGVPADFPPLRRDVVDEVGTPIPLGLPGYELRSRIGERTLGVVWRAYQPSAGREVAITLVRPALIETSPLAHRFDIGARSAARLSHPHILPVLDHWRDADGAVVVSPFVNGAALTDVRPTAPEAIRLIRQLAAALDHAHAHGVTHGAIAAENVVVDSGGNAYFPEFGIAGAFAHIDERADRFALGALARELIPADDATAAVFARATAPQPDDRYSSAMAFVADLARARGLPLDDGLADAADTSARPPLRNPYKGLRAFDEADRADYYGRDPLVAELVSVLTTARLVTVVGPSGSGKSSLVRAGLLPALGSGAIAGSDVWEHVVMTPGSDPATTLERSLTQSSGDVAIVIDQLEELFTMVDDPAMRHRFVEVLEAALHDGQRSVRVVTTLRADYFDRPLNDPRLALLVTTAVVTVAPPDADALTEMVTAPAHAVGLRWEPGLAARIVRDALAGPGGLPLAQYALTELVERRHGDLLTASDYERIGCVTGAVAMRAEATYGGLTEPEQATAQRLLLRLVTVDDNGSSEARRRVRRSELETLGIVGSELDRVLDAFVDQRLLLADHDPVTRTPTIEVAHEALLEAWPRLRDWIDVEREALVISRRFRAALGDWEASGRDPAYLIGGSRLAAYDLWAGTSQLSSAEREFYDLCTRAEDGRRCAARRRRNVTIGVLTAVAVTTTTLGFVALEQARRAATNADAALAERDRAELQTRVARGRELTAAAVAAVDTDPGLAKLLALEAVDVTEPTAETISVLRQAIAMDRTIARHPWPTSIERTVGIAISPDGSMAAFAGPTAADPDLDHLEVRDVATWDLLWASETRNYGVDGIWFSPDSSQLVTGLSTWLDADDVPLGVRRFDARTGEVLATHELGRCGATVSDLTSTVATLQVWPPAASSCTWEDVEPPLASLEVVDLDSGEVTVVEPAILDVRPKVSDDGNLVAFMIDADRPTIVVEEIDTGRLVAEIDLAELGVNGGLRELSPDGSLVVAGDAPLLVIDVASAQVVSRFGEHATPPHSLVWESEGSSIWSVAADGSILEWDPLDGSVLTALPGQGGSGDLRVSAGGEIVVVDDLNSRSMAISAPRRAAELWSVTACQGSGTPVGRSISAASGAAVAQFDCRDGLRTVALDSTGSTAPMATIADTPGVALSPTGTAVARRFATPSGDEIVVEPLGSGAPVTLAGSAEIDARSIAWSPDGRFVVVPERRRLVAWDAATGALLASVEVCELISDVVITPTSGEVVVGCFREPLAVVSTATWTTTERSDTDVGHFLTFIGHTSDGSTLMALNGGTGATSLLWLDPVSLDVIERLDDVHTGAPTAWAMSPSGTTVATSSGDGMVKVWNVAERRQVDELHLQDDVTGLGFIDDDVLLVATDRGLGASTLDHDELLRIARLAPSRQFTPAECERYAIPDC